MLFAGLLFLALLSARDGFPADISVVATVDHNRVSLGESFSYTITINGTQSDVQPPVLPAIAGLNFEGPSPFASDITINGARTISVRLTYRVTPTRLGDFTIPAVEVVAAGKRYQTAPIQIVVQKNAQEEAIKQSIYGRIRLPPQPIFLGQTAPLEVELFVRQDVPLKGISALQVEAEGLGYKFLQNLGSTITITNGVTFRQLTVDGSISPSRAGKLTFGPYVVKTQLRMVRRGALDDFGIDFPGFPSNVEIKELPVTLDPVSIEVLPLPEQGKPNGFAGAVGQWKLEVLAKPTEVTVGEPITLTVKISGTGNIDTVPIIKMEELDRFKAYEPNVRTTNDELHTTGQRIVEQVLVPKSTDARLPEMRLAYFDPSARQYKIARQDPIQLVVRPGAAAQTTIVGSGPSLKPKEKLGEDIVYLKGDLGRPAAAIPFCATSLFWLLNLLPALSFVGIWIWNSRREKLQSDVAYARRSRATKLARKMLATANTYDEVQRALQNYLGDRLNIPASGITASIVDDQLLPRGLNGELASELKACFEACDTARFAGGAGNQADVQSVRGKVEHAIHELEKKHI